MRNFLAAGGCAALALSAAACSSSEPVTCPGTAIVPELQSVAKFGPGPGRDQQDIAYGARLLAASANCDADEDKGGIEVSTKLGVSALRGKPEVRNGQVTYFVAVVDRGRNILAERDFAIDLKFPETQSRVETTEEHDVFVPVPKGGSGGNYSILFGFRLAPEELQYNRDHEPKPPGAKPAAKPG